MKKSGIHLEYKDEELKESGVHLENEDKDLKKSGVHLENEDKEKKKSGVYLENEDRELKSQASTWRIRMKKEKKQSRHPPGERGNAIEVLKSKARSYDKGAHLESIKQRSPTESPARNNKEFQEEYGISQMPKIHQDIKTTRNARA